MAEEVVLQVAWANSAKTSFNHIVEYLQSEWTEKETTKFINRTAEMIATLKRYPEMCRPSVKRKNVRIALLNKHTQLVYQYKPKKSKLKFYYSGV